MPEDFEKAYNGVLQAVQDGTISEERINDALRRIYRIKYADVRSTFFSFSMVSSASAEATIPGGRTEWGSNSPLRRGKIHD